MADKLQKSVKVAGSGILYIDGDKITIDIDEKGEYNLACVLSQLEACHVKFSFTYDEDYGDEEQYIDPITGEITED